MTRRAPEAAMPVTVSPARDGPAEDLAQDHPALMVEQAQPGQTSRAGGARVIGRRRRAHRHRRRQPGRLEHGPDRAAADRRERDQNADGVDSPGWPKK
jgi:hypothetical protein